MKIKSATRSLAEAVDKLSFPSPVAYVYNPLQYAWAAQEQYLDRYGRGTKRVLFLGMNPGPFGMTQTGVPFGEVAAVRDWMGIQTPIGKPPREHPGKPVQGFACPRSEVSGRRLWGLFAEKFKTPEAFFARHFVHNYCPLLFLEDTRSGKNVTPETLPANVCKPLFDACDILLRTLVDELGIEWAVGVGGFATKRLSEVLGESKIKITTILHPSPASPAANRDWAGTATRQLQAAGIWP